MLPNHIFTNNRDNEQSDEKLCIYFFKPLMIEVRLPIFQRTKMIALCDRSVAGMIIFTNAAVYLPRKVLSGRHHCHDISREEDKDVQPDQVGHKYKSPGCFSSLLRYRGGQELFHHGRQ